MKGKVSLITGANAGIGKRAAKRLAGAGSAVIMVCRNANAGEKAAEEIRQETGNGDVKVLQADLASQGNVRRLAKTVLGEFERLDVLIHNAANFDLSMKRPVLTEDGVENIFATNHLAPFLLTNLLLSRLEQSAPSRIITIASKGLLSYPRMTIEFDNLNGEMKYSPTRAYYHSKLAQLMFTYELAERLKGTGVTANAIRVPSVKVDAGRYNHLPAWMGALYRIKRRFSIDPEQMAETYFYLSAAPSLLHVSGKYFDELNREVASSRSSYDKAVWGKLWEVSEKLTGLK